MTHAQPTSEPAKVGDIWFRYEDRRYASVNEWDEITSVRVELQLVTYKVLKVTPKGVWLDLWLGAKRFVRLEARKRFAHPTKQEALLSLKARKEAQAGILQKQLNDAERAAALADRELAKLNGTPQPVSNELELHL